MNKIELEAKVDALQDEINFLRAIYETVSSILLCLANQNVLVLLLCKGR